MVFIIKKSGKNWQNYVLTIANSENFLKKFSYKNIIYLSYILFVFILRLLKLIKYKRQKCHA